VIDTSTDQIVRVLPTGPIPKYVAASPDGKKLAVIHWGDNTAGIIDVSSNDPAKFKWASTLVVEKRLPLKNLGKVNRDKQCGFCLRGAVFTADSKTLLVARMGGGGIAGFDVATSKYLGTVLGMKPTPRHLALSADGATLFASSNVSGFVSKIAVSRITAALAGAKGAKVELGGWEDVYVGGGARTLVVSPDGRFLYVAVQSSAEIVAVDAKTLDIAGRVRADAYPVGLAISPDGKTLWVTSQGRGGRGGNSVCIFRTRDIAGGKPLAAPTPPATIDTSAGDED
jgi:DNA-binding beta-propeller fold protein YncE